MPYKNLKRRTERSKERRHENPSIHRKSDAKYKLTTRGQYSSLKARAKKRGITVTLTETEYTLFRNQCCYYCNNTLPLKGYGLDRKDNKKGYDVDNVVACCGPCNRIRGDDLTHEEMIIAMKAVIEYRQNT